MKRRNISRLIAMMLVLAQTVLLVLAVPLSGAAEEAVDTTPVILHSNVEVVIDGTQDPIWNAADWSSSFGYTSDFNVVSAVFAAPTDSTPIVRYKALWHKAEDGSKCLYVLLDVADATQHSATCENAACKHPTCNDDNTSNACDREADRFLMLVSEDVAKNGEVYGAGANANEMNARMTDEILRSATGKVISGNYFEAQIVRNDATGYTAECKYTFAADADTDLSQIQLDIRVTDGGVDATKCTDSTCGGKSAATAVAATRYSWHIGGSSVRFSNAQKIWDDRIENVNLGSVEESVGTESPIAVDVQGKTVTVDGAMGADEGWAKMPFALLDSLRTNPTQASTQESELTENQSQVRVSYDDNFVYLYFETYQAQNNSMYFQIGFNGAKRNDANAKGNYVEFRINTTATATSESGRNETVIDMLYHHPGQNYAAGDAIYDNTKVAVVKGEGVVSVELSMPIPDSVKTTRLKKDCEVTLGLWERLGADTDKGLVASEGYSWTVGMNSFVLKKNESAEFENFKAWLEESKNTANHEALKQLTVNVMADDTLAGGGLLADYLWTSMLTTKYEWTLKTEIVSGSGIAASVGDLRPMSKTWLSLANNAPDVVIISGGLNDYLNNVAIGTLEDDSDDTFMGAIKAVIKGVRKKYSNDVCIIFVTPYNFPATNAANTLTYSDYANAMVQVCEANGAYCFKASDPAVSGVDMQNETFRAANCMSADNSANLNLDGMKLLMPKIETFIADSIAHWEENKDEIIADLEAKEDKKPSGGNTTTEPETNAPTTQAPAGNTGGEKKSGCKSSVNAGMIVVILAIAVCAAPVCFKLRREE